jgi:tRNA A37 N6-isopentenylltransferase MiaA
LIRKIELLSPFSRRSLAEGVSPSSPFSRQNSNEVYSNFEGIEKEYDILKIGITAPKDVLDERIDQRVIKRVKLGMIQEAKDLYGNGLSLERMRQLGLEYGVLADLMNGIIPSEDKFVNVLQVKIHQYAKRQLTYFRKEKNVDWFDITGREYIQKVEKKVMDWYNAKAT